MKIKKIEHLGIACHDVNKTAAFYHGVLGLDKVSEETLEDMKLRIVKVRSGESVLELLEPLEGETVISKYLAERGEGVHHVCFEVESIEQAMASLREKGFEPIWKQPKVGAGGKWVNFLRPKDSFGVLLEINQDPQSNDA